MASVAEPADEVTRADLEVFSKVLHRIDGHVVIKASDKGDEFVEVTSSLLGIESYSKLVGGMTYVDSGYRRIPNPGGKRGLPKEKKRSRLGSGRVFIRTRIENDKRRRAGEMRLIATKREPAPGPPSEAALVAGLPTNATLTDLIDSLGPWVRGADVEARYGISRQAMQKKRDSRQILGVKLGSRNEMFYPVKQFDDQGEVVAGLKPVLDELRGIDPLSIVTMLSAPAFSDSKTTVWEQLREGKLERVLDWARQTRANRQNS